MSLRKRSTIFAIVTIATVLILVFVFSEFVILKGFNELEKNRTTTNIKRAQNAISAEIERLHVFTADWAYWDDTYKFVQDKNQDYLKSNLPSTTFELTGLNIIIIRSKEGEVLYQGAYDLEEKKAVAIPSEIFDHLKSEVVTTNSHDGKAGIVMLNNGPMIISSRPVLTSEQKGPVMGNILMGFYITPPIVNRLSITTELDLTIKSLKETDVKDFEVKIIDSEKIEGLGMVKDVYGKDAFVVDFLYPRDIFKEGQKTVTTLLVGLFSIGLVVTLIGIIYLERNVLFRLSELLSELNKIETSNNYSGRVVVRGKDEIGKLALSINSMLTALEESEESRFSASINSLPLGFFIVGLDHTFAGVNPAAISILGLSNRPEKFEELAVVFGPDFDLKNFCAHCRRDTKIVTIDEFNFKSKILKLVSVPIINKVNGQLMGTAVIVEDVTESRMLAHAKDEFLAIASHELRTPLTIIRGNTSLIKDYFVEQIKDHSLVEIFNDIHESVVRLINIVNDFLDVSRLEQESKSTKLATTPIDVTTIIKESIDGLMPKAKEKNLYIKYIGGDKDTVDVDPSMVRHILDNLIANSLSFTKEGGVEISTAIDGEFLRVIVNDTGKGISPEYQKLLFKKFEQAGGDVRRRDVTHGTGLGLYLSKLLVSKMKGDIRLDKSELGKGSTFSFTLPLAR